MDGVSSRVAGVWSLPSLPPPSASHRRHCGRRRNPVPSSSSVRTLSPAPSFSARLRLSRTRSPVRRTPPVKPHPPRRTSGVAFAQFNVVRVLSTAWRIAKDGIEAGTNLIPDSIPRPVARICVAGLGATVTIFLLQSLLSTAFFVLAMMGLIYFTYIAFNASEGSSGGSDTTTSSSSSSSSTEEEALEEARRIMEKYK